MNLIAATDRLITVALHTVWSSPQSMAVTTANDLASWWSRCFRFCKPSDSKWYSPLLSEYYSVTQSTSVKQLVWLKKFFVNLNGQRAWLGSRFTFFDEKKPVASNNVCEVGISNLVVWLDVQWKLQWDSHCENDWKFQPARLKVSVEAALLNFRIWNAEVRWANYKIKNTKTPERRARCSDFNLAIRLNWLNQASCELRKNNCPRSNCSGFRIGFLAKIFCFNFRNQEHWIGTFNLKGAVSKRTLARILRESL